MERTSKIIFSLLILLVLNGVVWGIIIFEPKVSKMIFLNVGQGDATLLSFVNSGNILVDAGPNSSILNELGKFLGFFNKKIDVVILSHTNLDHYGGLFDVLNKYQPRVLVYNGFSSKSETFAKLLEDFKNNDSQIVVFKAGDKIKIGLDEVDFIWPPSDSVIKDDNNGSLIFKVLIRNYKILFLGDADFKTIKKIGSDLMADILKISHHGSKTGTDSDLIWILDNRCHNAYHLLGIYNFL